MKVYHDDCKDVCGPQVDESCQNCMTSSAETHAKSLDISYSFFTTSRDSCPWYKAAACTAAILAAVPLCVDPVTFEVCMVDIIGAGSYCDPCICDVSGKC